jgi:outer membrane receptor protein involved in Fe transport
MRRRAETPALLILAILILTTPILSGTAADLKGKVTDRTGAPLPGATVVLRNETLAVGERGTVTDAEGNFRLFRLPPGRGYRVRVSLATYAPVEFSDIELANDQTYILDVVLRPAKELQEIVRVRGHADLVDTESVVTSTTFSAEFISGLPILGRDYQDILSLAPGVTDVNGTGNPNIHGARDTDVVTLVDGVSTTDPYTGYYGQQLNIESIEQIEVITAGAPAEYSRAQGGFANIVTKSGGNEFEGSFKFFLRTDRLDGDGAGIDPPELRGGLGESESLRELRFTDLYPFLSLSGPFRKDRAWYYLTNEFIQVETPVNAVSQAFVTRTRGYREFGKATIQISPAHKAVFSLSVDRTKDENQGLGSQTALESGYSFKRGGPTFTFKETAIFSPTFLLESSASWFDNSFERKPELDPDTNGNGILFVDDRPELGGNGDGYFQARERDPGEDYDRDRAYDLFEDFNRNNRLDLNEDRDLDGRLTPRNGCEGDRNEDGNCNGFLDREFDLNQNGVVDPDEDMGLPGYPGTAGNGRFDSEDRNANNDLDTVGDSGPTSFPFYFDANGNGRREIGEFQSPLFPDRDFVVDRTEGRITGPNPFEFSDNRKRLTLRQDLSLYLDGFGGSHDLKLGFVFEHEGFDRDTVVRPLLEVRLQQGRSITNTLQQGGTVDAHLPSRPFVNNTAVGDNVGIYLHDTYKPLANLTISVGVRFDYESLRSFGFSYFEPADERSLYNSLMNLAGLELGYGDDLNADGIIDVGICSDPLYRCDGKIFPVPEVGALVSDLKALAPRRLSRHNFETEVESRFLTTVLGRDADLNDLLEAGFNSRREETIRVKNANVAPRLSVNWDPWADGKSKAFASWNRFYDKLFLNTMVLEEGPDDIVRYYSFDANGIDFFGLPNNQIGKARTLAPPTAFQVDRRISTPFTDEILLGFQRELAPEFSVGITYVRRDYKRQLQDIDVNHSTRIDPLTGRFKDVFGLEDSPIGFGDEGVGFGVQVPDGRPDLYIENFFFNQVFRLGNYNEQTYRGLELELIRRLSRRWQMQASYTLSRTQGDAESFLADEGDDPTLTEYEPGYLDYDQRHVAKFHAIANLPGDWRIGGTAQWASGLPFSVIDQFDAQDDVGYRQSRRRFGHTDPIEGFQTERRNFHRNPATYTLNARAQKNFIIGKMDASAFFEVFNLLNSDSLRVYTIEPDLRGLQSDAERRFGRRFELGIQLSF